MSISIRSRLVHSFGLGLFIRVALLVYSEWHDSKFHPQYTDVDYFVFSDAGAHLLAGASPYDRTTFRYTPILALIASLNHILGTSYAAKLIFILFDFLVAFLLLAMANTASAKTAVSVFWILNPMVFSISTRGNAESLVCFSVILVLYLLQTRTILLAGIAYGFAVHLKLFPIIHIFPILSWIFTHPYPIQNSLRFAISSFLTFSLLLIIFHNLYGFIFIYETYLHHLIRKDHRHNFSVYFYPIYLALHEPHPSLLLQITSLLPSLLTILTISLKFATDLPLSCFLSTFVFVAFNKVITSQYFLWYICLIPLISSKIHISPTHLFFLCAGWFAVQGLWLSLAFKLEFQGQNTFFPLWLASILFLLYNVFLVTTIAKSTSGPRRSKNAVIEIASSKPAKP